MIEFESLLYFVDEESAISPAMELAVLRAGALAARLTFASVVPRSDSLLGARFGAKRLEQLSIEAERERLEEIVRPLRGSGAEIATQVLVGDPATAIVRAVVADGYQMVWKAPTQRTARDGMTLHSIDKRLLRACPCPVAIVRGGPEERRRVTVAAIDVASEPGAEDVTRELNEKVLALANTHQVSVDTRLHVVHAWTLYGESIMRSPRARVEPAELDSLLEGERAAREQRLDALIADFRSKLVASGASGFEPEAHLVKGDPSSVILGELDRLEADLLVIGTVSRRGVTGFLLGNTAEKIFERVQCSVLATKPKGFVTPVPIT